MLKDANGNEITVGCRIAYPGISGHQLFWKTATIWKITMYQDWRKYVRTRFHIQHKNGTRSYLQRPERCRVIEPGTNSIVIELPTE